MDNKMVLLEAKKVEKSIFRREKMFSFRFHEGWYRISN
jgi:hypothetical protein